MPLMHHHEPVETISTDRLQLEFWRVLQGEPWGETTERMVALPARHVERLLQHAARLENVLARHAVMVDP
jgi:hypothetical protein